MAIGFLAALLLGLIVVWLWAERQGGNALKLTLRFLILLVLAGGAYLAIGWFTTNPGERALFAVLREHGGHVERDKNRQGEPIVRVTFPFKPVTEQAVRDMMPHLLGLDHLIHLDFLEVQLPDAALKHLAQLQRLQGLDVRSAPITDAGLRDLAGMKQLTFIGLSGTLITDAGLKELAGWKQLRNLHVSGTRVTDAGLKDVARMEQLEALDLRNTRITNSGLRELTGLKTLRFLHLQGTTVTEDGVQELQKALPECRINR